MHGLGKELVEFFGELFTLVRAYPRDPSFAKCGKWVVCILLGAFASLRATFKISRRRPRKGMRHTAWLHGRWRWFH